MTLDETSSVHYKWLGPDELSVEVWGWETVTDKVDETKVTAWLDAGVLHLEHGVMRVDPSADGAVPACLIPVRLIYHVSGLPRGRYRVDARGTRPVRGWIDG